MLICGGNIPFLTETHISTTISYFLSSKNTSKNKLYEMDLLRHNSDWRYCDMHTLLLMASKCFSVPSLNISSNLSGQYFFHSMAITLIYISSVEKVSTLFYSIHSLKNAFIQFWKIFFTPFVLLSKQTY